MNNSLQKAQHASCWLYFIVKLEVCILLVGIDGQFLNECINITWLTSMKTVNTELHHFSL